jgi:hypothetical protein
MVEYGNPSQFVRLIIKLETVGPVPVIVGKGVVLIVGRSLRGPVDEAVAMTSSAYAKDYFYSGGLKDGVELIFGQGAPVVYAVRVLGLNHVTATKTLTDGLTGDFGPNNVVKLDASSPGIWGNSCTVKVLQGSYKATETTPYGIQGAATVGPYATQYANLYQSTANWVKVDGVSYNSTNSKLIYNGSPTATQVSVDTINGSLTFGTSIPATSVITYSLKYYTVKIIISDNETTYTYDNISSLVKLVARLNGTGFITATATVGETHLPYISSITTYQLTGGLDGDTITTDDWKTALTIGGEAAAELIGAPQCACLTEYEVAEGTHDLIPELDAWSMEMANKFHPCQCFVALAPNLTAEQALEIAAGYSNRLLTLVANGWDNSETLQNIAVARAGKEAAVAIGESAALPRNAMNGLNGLLNTYEQADVDHLTQDTDARCDAIIKSRGIRPYVGITTDQTWQFLRTVDNRTINWVIVCSNEIAKQYFHEKRTTGVMANMKASIASVLNDLLRDENIRAYTLDVYPHETDTGKVIVKISMENIGHIERIDETIAVGILNDNDTGVITSVSDVE